MQNIDTTPLGSRRHHYVGRKGDLRVELHYADPHRDTCGREACLYVFRAREPKAGALIPFCQMWQFDPRAISARAGTVDADRLAAVVKKLVRHLYGIETQSDEHRILDVMCDYMDDLKDHPPEAGLDRTLDEFLADCDDEGLEFFVEVNGKRIIG